jgi:hypothetical protein
MYRKIRMVLQLLQKMQLHIRCTIVKLAPHVYVPEEPGGLHTQEAEGCQ